MKTIEMKNIKAYRNLLKLNKIMFSEYEDKWIKTQI